MNARRALDLLRAASRARLGPRGRRAARAVCGVLLAPVLALIVAAALTPLPRELSVAEYGPSLEIDARDGSVLREIRADDATRARWVPLAEMGPEVPRAMMAAEDLRFRSHPGVDPLAVARATAGTVLAGHVVSGASTLTMQLARLVRPHPRTLAGKLGEMALALRIEASLSKDQILEQYLNRAPFGPELRGIDAASRHYFGKAPAELSLAEACALAAMPRGPTLYDMDRHPERVRRRRDRILDRMFGAGLVDADHYHRAKTEPLVVRGARSHFGAPHFVRAVADGKLGGGVALGRASRVVTTLDPGLQGEAERAVARVVTGLRSRHVTAGAAVVLDNETGEILAYVGSPSWTDDAHGGKNDGVRALRQPGSSLKPFLYGLAMDRGALTTASVLDDTALRIATPGGGDYVPHNYDQRFHGPVRLREALANSYNVPAVRTLLLVGDQAALDELHAFGFASLTGRADDYGPALALGDGEVTLLELAGAYATLARGGITRPVVAVREVDGAPVTPPGDSRRVMPRAVADVITDILADRDARLASFGERSMLELPVPVAAKTGTSKGFRDNVAVGFTRRVTVAAWAGNFDGSAMAGVSGITGAGPIFHEVMEAASRRYPERPGERPLRLQPGRAPGLVRVKVCALSGKRAAPDCPHAIEEWLPAAKADALDTCTMHQIVGVDTRNGLRAGPACPRGVVADRVFEVFPPELAGWAAAAHRESAPRDFSPLCGPSPRGGAADVAVRIAEPLDGSRYVLDPDAPRERQALTVRLVAPAGRARVLVDGRPVPTQDLVARWSPTPGEHVLRAEVGGVRSEAVHVHVE